MNTIAIAVTASLAFVSLARAEGMADPAAPAPMGMDSRAPHSAIVQNGSACAPDKATPVIGANGENIGYKCIKRPANGQ